MAASLENIDTIDDEDVLESLINKTSDLDVRRKIRKRQSVIREKRLAAFEANRQDRLTKQEDALGMRQRMAEDDKQRKLRDLQEQAAAKTAQQEKSGTDVVKDRMAKAEEEKQRKLVHLKEVGKNMSAAYNVNANEILKEKEAGRGISSPASPTSPTAAGATGGAPRPNITRNPSAIKQMLLDWCKAQCQGYENVNITNFSGSWSDGMAFCALIHHFFPESFDFSKLNPKNRRGNFKLAFDLAEKLADISPLLDVEDMVRMKNPDWKCVFTYVQSFYRRFAMQKQQAPPSPSSPTAAEN
jgi:hypothetical protein